MTDSLQLYRSQEHDCAYLPDTQAITHFVDPAATLNTEIYNRLLTLGFRRSGSHIYKPHCPSCHACIPIRLPIAKFSPNRSQRRVWAKNSHHLMVTAKPAKFQQEHFELYCRYINTRHSDGEMANPTPESYLNFLTTSWCNTKFFEFHIADKLAAIAVTDILPKGLSAVYTFFDPELAHLSPGVLAVLWQIHEARQRGLPWLYLGYWVPNCRKMSYKSNYRPLQIHTQDQWQEFGQNEDILAPGIY